VRTRRTRQVQLTRAVRFATVGLALGVTLEFVFQMAGNGLFVVHRCLLGGGAPDRLSPSGQHHRLDLHPVRPRPSRRCIQETVDRRFSRRKYNAARTIQAFSARLRDEVDLDTLLVELLAVVDQTIQPTRASLLASAI
jgi:hypothetical protein